MRNVIIFLLLLSNYCYSQNNFGEWVDTLSSSYFFGRGPVNFGDSLSSVYISSVFQEYGLDVQKQDFKDDVVIIDKNPILGLGDIGLKFGDDFVINTNSKPGIYKAKAIIITDDANCPTMGKCWKNKAIVISSKMMRILISDETFKEKFAEAKMIIELVKGVPYSNMTQNNVKIPHVRV